MLLPFRSYLLTRLLVFLSVLPVAASTPRGERSPVPNASAQEASLTEIKKIFKAEYASTRTSQKLDLAKKLLALAPDASMAQDAAGRFVLLTQARDLSAGVGDVSTCMAAIDQLDQGYVIDALPMRVACVADIVKRGGPSAGVGSLSIALDLCEQCLAIDDFDGAARMVVASKAAVNRSGDEKLGRRLKSAEFAIGEYESVRPHLERLKEKPTDPDACLAAGRYYCFIRRDFDFGAPLLTNGVDPLLKSLGELETQNPADPGKKREMGDAWFEWSQSQQGNIKRSAEWRAAYWYKLAKPELDGLAKAAVEKRLHELGVDKEEAGDAGAGDRQLTKARRLAAASPPRARREVPWAEVLEELPDASKITDAKLCERIRDSGLPWRVRDRASGIELLAVPAGEYQRGTSPGDPDARSDEFPRHSVVISRAFYMGRYEVQASEWQHVMKGRASEPEALGMPVAACHDSADAFLAKCPGLRLPTEAEWEYACRAGTVESRYASIDACAWSTSNADGVVHQVGQKQANVLGLHDMLGNLWELCSDYYDMAAYASCAGGVSDPIGPASGSERVMRGGNYNATGTDAWCRASHRGSGPPGKLYSTRGFRVARTP